MYENRIRKPRKNPASCIRPDAKCYSPNDTGKKIKVSHYWIDENYRDKLPTADDLLKKFNRK